MVSFFIKFLNYIGYKIQKNVIPTTSVSSTRHPLLLLPGLVFFLAPKVRPPAPHPGSLFHPRRSPSSILCLSPFSAVCASLRHSNARSQLSHMPPPFQAISISLSSSSPSPLPFLALLPYFSNFYCTSCILPVVGFFSLFNLSPDTLLLSQIILPIISTCSPNFSRLFPRPVDLYRRSLSLLFFLADLFPLSFLNSFRLSFHISVLKLSYFINYSFFIL